jgi:hypothetical protein
LTKQRIRRKDKREAEKGTNYFFEFIRIKNHFFKELSEWLKRVEDHRHQSYVKYDTDIILFMVILKNICDLTTMRNMTESLNKEECIENIKKVLSIEELDELPHYDTINDFLSGLNTSELEDIRTYMIKVLLKKRCLEDFRTNGKYWGIIFDGTGLYSFNEKHCEHCLKRIYNKGTEEEKTVYMHHVLEAKLVAGDMVLSIGTEFIENESEDVTKQDCELKAFYRLAPKIKSTYKRLPICILGDSLYACEPVFKLCDEYGWKYLFRFKEGRIKTVAAEFNAIKEIEKKEKVISDIYWAKDISYNERKVNMIEFTLDTDNKKRFVFITNLNITERNVKGLVAFGRSRWKIENQGFNNQKNIRYDIEHTNSHNYTAMKNHYILTQIADIIMQLYENGLKIFRIIKKTAKEISSNLLEAIRTRRLTAEDILHIANPKQIRFT